MTTNTAPARHYVTSDDTVAWTHFLGLNAGTAHRPVERVVSVIVVDGVMTMRAIRCACGAWVESMPQRPAPTAYIVDEPGVLVVAVNYHDGRGPQFGGSYPTHVGAAYPEARERGYREALAKARERVAEYTRR